MFYGAIFSPLVTEYFAVVDLQLPLSCLCNILALLHCYVMVEYMYNILILTNAICVQDNIKNQECLCHQDQEKTTTQSILVQIFIM